MPIHFDNSILNKLFCKFDRMDDFLYYVNISLPKYFSFLYVYTKHQFHRPN